jgi:hypothetical protein
VEEKVNKITESSQLFEANEDESKEINNGGSSVNPSLPTDEVWNKFSENFEDAGQTDFEPSCVPYEYDEIN